MRNRILAGFVTVAIVGAAVAFAAPTPTTNAGALPNKVTLQGTNPSLAQAKATTLTIGKAGAITNVVGTLQNNGSAVGGGGTTPAADNTSDVGDSTHRWATLWGITHNSGASTLTIKSGVATGSTAVGITLATSNTLSTTGAKQVNLVDGNTVEFGYFRRTAGSLGLRVAATGQGAYGGYVDLGEYGDITIGSGSGFYVNLNQGSKTFAPSSNQLLLGYTGVSWGGLYLGTTSVNPTCASGERGHIRILQNASGTQDQLLACMKSSAGTFSWITVATGG